MEFGRLVLVALVLVSWEVAGQLGPAQFNSFNGKLGADLVDLIVEEEVPTDGVTPAHLVIQKVVAYPEEGGEDVVVLRNIGGQTLDLAGWTMGDAENVEMYKFGEGSECEEFSVLEPTGKMTIWPKSDDNPCGFTFTIGFRDALSVFNADGEVVARVSWNKSEQGSAFVRKNNGEYVSIAENTPVLDTLKLLGNFNIFLRALKATGLDNKLDGARDPDYSGIDPSVFEPPPPPPVTPQFPGWFGFEFNRSTLPPPPPPPPAPPVPKGVPSQGPYTLLAPTDAAFDAFRTLIAGPGNPPLAWDEMFKMPELVAIMLYHIIPGEWTSEYLKNSIPVYTAKGVEVVPFTRGAMTEGKIMLHDSCVDKLTPDPFDCLTQVEFNKCNDPFMISPVSANWQGGYCQRTCGRCSCDPSLGVSCSEVENVDIMASNGVVHSITRVLLPPPVFTKSNSSDPSLLEQVISNADKEQAVAEDSVPESTGPTAGKSG